jgi:transcriptional regulator with XRE-family HTH domain
MGTDSTWAPLVLRLVKARKEAGLTQIEVAQMMGVSQPTVSEFERCLGDDGPRIATIQRYARAVDMRITWRIGPRSNE